MRKLTVSAFISLDGVNQAPGGPGEDPSGDFRLGGWIVPYADEAIGQNLQDLLSQPFEFAAGALHLRHIRGVLAARTGRFKQPHHR